jgi:hypothetical protein
MASSVSAEEKGHLELDGILKVRGMDLSGARMVMVDHLGHAVVLNSGLAHFSVPLELNSEYLLEFTREGCVTKQVLVDTRVPTGDYVFRNYGFPFQVTLQSTTKGQGFAYDGPVARVHFVPAIDDFGYDTDYRVKPMPALAQAMNTVRAGLDSPTPPNAVPVSGQVPRADAPQDPLPPMVSEAGLVPVVGPVTSMEPAPVVVPPDPTAPAMAQAALPVPVPPDPLTEVPKEAVADAPSMDPPAFVRQPARTRAPRATPAPVPAPRAEPIPPVTISGHVLMDADREEAVVVEHLRVIRIVRIVEDGRVVEFRRVTPRYGDTIHFRNGQACTARAFEQGVGE